MDQVKAGGQSQYVDPEVVARLLKFADLLVLLVGSLVLFSRFSTPAGDGAAAIMGFLCLTLALASLVLLRGFRLYDVRLLVRPVQSIGLSFVSMLTGGVAVASLAALTVLELQLAWFSGWVVLCAIHCAGSRTAALAWAHPLADSGAFTKRIAIVGGGEAAEQAINVLEASGDLDVEIVGLFDDRQDKRSPASIKRFAKLGKIADLAEYARTNRVDLIIVAIPMSAEARLLQVLRRLWELPVEIRISALSSKLKLAPAAYRKLGDLPLLPVFERPLSGWGSFMKAVFDRVAAAGLIVMLSPVMLATAAAIKFTSTGPVIFRQKRYGFNNELVEIFKFRSMFTDQCDANASRLVSKGDSRVTPVGRFIRKTSIDELPQLFNVLTGNLSLVGPRPHATQAKAADELYEQVVDGYFARHKVKPGITGWAQINGWRGETDTHEKIENRVQHDLEYIDRSSLWFDFYILAKTPFALLNSANAKNAF